MIYLVCSRANSLCFRAITASATLSSALSSGAGGGNTPPPVFFERGVAELVVALLVLLIGLIPDVTRLLLVRVVDRDEPLRMSLPLAEPKNISILSKASRLFEP